MIFGSDSVLIQDSCKVIDKKQMLDIIQTIKKDKRCPDVVKNRTTKSLYREWKAHNIMYKLHIFRSHTKDVDFDYEPWYRQVVYFLICLL